MTTKRTRKEEAELVAAVLREDAGAQELFFREIYPYVHKVCYQLMKNREDADEFAQVTMIQIFRKLRQFRGESALTSWCYIVAKRECLMEFRKRGNVPDASLDEKLETGFAPRARDLENVLDRMLLKRAIGNLPPSQKSVIYYHDILGYDHHETGRILGVSEGTSKSNLFKARKNLRRQITRWRAPQTGIES